MTVRSVGKVITIVGIILILGALGAADCETVSFARVCLALAFRIPFTLVGVCMSGFGE